MYDLTKSLGLTKKNNPYLTTNGNGTKIKTYYFDKNSGKTKTNLNEKNEPIYHNLYEDIQLQTPSTNYKKLINKNSTLDEIKMIFDTKYGNNDTYLDTTQIGDLETLKKTENQIINTFGSLENYKKYQDTKINNFSKQIKLEKENYLKRIKKLQEKQEKELEAFNAFKNQKK